MGKTNMAPSIEGSITLTVLAALLFLSILGMTLSLYTERYFRIQEKVVSREIRKIELQKIGQSVIEQFSENLFPEIDFPVNPLSLPTGNLEEAITVQLKDISSKINLNHIDAGLLTETELKDKLGLYVSKEEFEELRSKKGLTQSFSKDYASLIPPAFITQFFSPYSWFNANVSSKEAISELIIERKLKQSDSDSNDIESVNNDTPGTETSELYPFVNLEPLYNVYYLDNDVIKAIIDYCMSGREEKVRREKYNLLIEQKEYELLDRDKIIEIIDAESPGEKKVLDYLGTVTWFWMCQISDGTLTLKIIFCRMPGSESPGEIQYRILESSFN